MKVAGVKLVTEKVTPRQMPSLSRREVETLALLLSGSSEKQVAAKLALSIHTVHLYVKQLHHRFGSSSRTDLFSSWMLANGMRVRAVHSRRE
jgi:DNA-binding CsgD family transcriptional regulator